MRTVAVAILLVCLATSASATSARQEQFAVTAIAAERERCRTTETYPSPSDLQQCDAAAIQEAVALTVASGTAPGFEAWLTDLFEPLLFTATGGDDALAARTTVTAALAEFVLRRADILLHDETGAVAGDTNSSPLHRLRGDAGVDDLLKRWEAIRDADCAVYRVSDCAARLDEALAEMVSLG